MGKTDEKINVENITIPGSMTRVNRAMYDAMWQAICQVLPTDSPGFTQNEIREAVIQYLPEDLYPAGAKAGWWAKTVQLDQEAKGNIIRETTKPLRWYRVP